MPVGYLKDGRPHIQMMVQPFTQDLIEFQIGFEETEVEFMINTSFPGFDAIPRQLAEQIGLRYSEVDGQRVYGLELQAKDGIRTIAHALEIPEPLSPQLGIGYLTGRTLAISFPPEPRVTITDPRPPGD